MEITKLHEDGRGSINIITGEMDHEELTIFHTNAGFARGGCIHNESDEHVVVISGKIIYVSDDFYEPLAEGESILIPKETPHYFISITDSIVMEWGAKAEEKKNKHPEYRKIVEDFNARHTSDRTAI